MNKYLKTSLLVGIYGIIIYVLTSGTPTTPVISDFAFYVRMAQGDSSVPEPWSLRPFVPAVANLLGGTEAAFHYLNMLLLLMTSLVLALTYKNYVIPIFFLFGTHAVDRYAGEPGLDAMMYFLVAMSIYLTTVDNKYLSTAGMCTISVAAAATHPMAFILTTIVFIFDKRPEVIIVGAIVALILLPCAYGVLYLPDVARLRGIVYSLSFLWIGILTFNRDSDSARDLLILLGCFSFTLLASNVTRMIAPAGLILAPRALEFMRRLVD